MKKIYFILITVCFIMMLSAPPGSFACFGDKLGIGYINGVESEFTAQLISIYIKEKTGIDSIVNEFDDAKAVNKSLKKDETDIIVWSGKPDELDLEKMTVKKKGSKFFLLLISDDRQIVLEVSKKRLEGMEYFTLNKLMERVGSLITPAEFNKSAAKVKSGEKFPKQAAREYLVRKDLI